MNTDIRVLVKNHLSVLGPMFTLLGQGVWAILLVIGSAVLGTYVYGRVRGSLPH